MSISSNDEPIGWFERARGRLSAGAGPEVERHARTRQLELGRAIADRRKIYLDTRYWILLRDVALQGSCKGHLADLLEALKRGVKEETLICPISAATFLELVRQPLTPGRRPATVALVDELSLGVSLMEPRRIMHTEVASFLHMAAGGPELHGMQELVWTKAAFALGDAYVLPKHLPAEIVPSVQREVFDRMWNAPLAAMALSEPDAPFPRPDGRFTRSANARATAHAHEVISFKAAYEIEIGGIAEQLGSETAELLAALEEAGPIDQMPPEMARRYANFARNCVVAAVAQERWRSVLRSLHIAASVHASVRWDKARKLKPNDWLDFEHAAAALGYCDLFLTERSLHHLVTRPQMRLDGVTACQVASRPADALVKLEELLANGSTVPVQSGDT